MSYEWFTAGGNDHMVESKQANQEDGTERKFPTYIYMSHVNRLYDETVNGEMEVEVALRKEAVSFKCGEEQTLLPP